MTMLTTVRNRVDKLTEWQLRRQIAVLLHRLAVERVRQDGFLEFRIAFRYPRIDSGVIVRELPGFLESNACEAIPAFLVREVERAVSSGGNWLELLGLINQVDGGFERATLTWCTLIMETDPSPQRFLESRWAKLEHSRFRELRSRALNQAACWKINSERDLSEGIRILRRAIKEDPSSISARINLWLYQLAEGHLGSIDELWRPTESSLFLASQHLNRLESNVERLWELELVNSATRCLAISEIKKAKERHHAI